MSAGLWPGDPLQRNTNVYGQGGGADDCCVRDEFITYTFHEGTLG